MDGTPRNGPPLPCSPLTALQARSIAAAFRPAHPWGNRRDYYYTRGKLGSDPLYDGVLQHLPDDGQPVLDLGCGLGLFAHVLRQRGGTQRYLGVDMDAGKIARAQRAATDLPDVHFECLDVQAPLPALAGHVLLLDVLQYLDAGAQAALLLAASARVTVGGRLLLRTPLATGDGRDRTTRVADRLAWLVGWMGMRPRHYPDPQIVQATLAAAGLQVTAPRPLHGRTPFNSWLLVAERP
ncbi:class I SAM-dependent methyltransferase [uncultured Stenotrophomonas sp.]|uniref:class I SAM-dependent methyltransferase n=1 Tax=uncultured Stenotrophomonas sp. TaxID=165438 RepID=UPI0025F58931|nr:class I SAM-dependent methyltransferase [uncultured Stenotrophomonas sp.]